MRGMPDGQTRGNFVMITVAIIWVITSDRKSARLEGWR